MNKKANEKSSEDDRTEKVKGVEDLRIKVESVVESWLTFRELEIIPKFRWSDFLPGLHFVGTRTVERISFRISLF